MGPENLIRDLGERFPGLVRDVSSPDGDVVMSLGEGALRPVCEFLKTAPRSFGLLLDVTCVDYRKDSGTFEMVYHLLSMENRFRVRIRVRLPGDGPVIDSLTALWKNADWLEREVYDMFGIRFNGHPNLKRILMYEGFEGHPLRKDYPLKRRQERKDGGLT